MTLADHGESIPLADDLEKAGMDARQAGVDEFVVKLPWRAGLVIAECVREYFNEERAPPCFVCGHHRETEIDRALECLDDAAFRLAYLIHDIETICTEQTGNVPLKGDDLLRERLKTEIKSGLAKQRVQMRRGKQKLPISDELRAIVTAWPEKPASPPKPESPE
jgi:hypothetical protein